MKRNITLSDDITPEQESVLNCFLTEYEQLCIKHNLRFCACGCCKGPIITQLNVYKPYAYCVNIELKDNKIIYEK